MASKEDDIQRALRTLRTYTVIVRKKASIVAHELIQAKNPDRAIVLVKAMLLSRGQALDNLVYEAFPSEAN